MITVRSVMPLILACFLVVSRVALAKSTAEEVGLGPQSTQAVGNKRVLMVVVRFPDAAPTTPIEVVKKKVIEGLGSYVDEQSYGLASITADFRGYVMLPDALADYRVSPYNFRVDKTRIRKLIGDTMTAIEKDTDFSAYDHFMIVPAVHTMPGQGYGMICYCANPGMLSGVTKGYVPRYVTMKSAGGKEFSGGIFVGAENANIGMFAHDYFHVLAGVHDGRRLVPCLYNYKLQSDASAGLPSFEHHATYMGLWDIMSQHFVKKGEPPQGTSSFTKIRLGWIKKHQVRIVKPGATDFTLLAPLSKGGQLLAVKIPLDDGSYYLVENRQPIGFDRMLPDSGIIVLKVNPLADEGYGTVEVLCAAGTGNFMEATYRLEASKRDCFVDERNNVTILPLWKQHEHVGVLITTSEHREAAGKAARAIQALIDQTAVTKDNTMETVILEAVTAFRNNEFEKSYTIAIKKNGKDIRH